MLLLRRSHVGLIKRLAARCERFEAAELRHVAAGKKPEAALTLRFARFLFDEGLDPFVDSAVSGLRPDLFVPRARLYVEAKQYSKDISPTKLRRYPAQVFDTWGRARNTHPLDEAFLAIFRRGGPRVEIPEVVTIHGRRLFSVVIDLVEGKYAGAAQKNAPVIIGEDEIIQWSATTRR